MAVCWSCFDTQQPTESWRLLAPVLCASPAYYTEAPAMASTVRAIDNNSVFLAGGAGGTRRAALVTDDAGGTYADITPPGAGLVLSFFAVDRQRLFFASRSQGFWLSQDGGLNWSRSPADLGLFGTADTSIDWNRIYFADSQNGLRFGSYYLSSFYADRTTDGGISWTRSSYGYYLDPARLSTAEPKVLGQISPDVFFARTGQYHTGFELIRFTNGGSSWSSRWTGNKPLYDVHFIDANNGWAVGQQLYLTTNDGGLSWTAQTNQVSNKQISWVRFRTSQIGFARAAESGVNDLFFQTTDGGLNWSAMPTTTDFRNPFEFSGSRIFTTTGPASAPRLFQSDDDFGTHTTTDHPLTELRAGPAYATTVPGCALFLL